MDSIKAMRGRRILEAVCCCAVVGVLALLASVGRLPAETPGTPQPPPNFIVIFVDDMGYGDIGPFGNTILRTPRLDRMAAEGMKLTSFYAAPCCTPSRAQLMTGSYAKRVGLNDGPRAWVLLPKDPIGLNPDEITIPELLKTRGYTTGCFGKWHLGDQREFLPTRHGFDEYFGLPYSNDMWPLFDESDDPRSLERRKEFNHAPLPLLRGEKVLQAVEDQSVLTASYTREAIRFIRENSKRPFFLYLPHSMVHVPLHPGKRFQGTSRHGKYGDAVEEIDWSTGQILDVIRELDLAERTLVLFTSDNGASLRWGGSNGPLRGGKGSTWEGGVRVPCIAWWPGRIKGGTVCNEITTTMDLLPTFAGLAGVPAVADRRIDGKDIWPLLSSEPGAVSPHEAFFYFSRRTLDAVRSGPWKLILKNRALYHLGSDLGESKDVALLHPDVIKRLQALAARASEDLGNGSPSFSGANVRRPGRVEIPRRIIRHNGEVVDWAAAGSPRESESDTTPGVRGWTRIRDFPERIAVLETVFWDPRDTISVRKLIRETSLVKGKTVLEIGTGSGILSLCCLKKGARKVVATDVNTAALDNALYNARILGVKDRFETRLVPLDRPGAYSVIGDNEKFDLLISNPPWVDRKPETISEYALYDAGFYLLRTMLEGLRDHLEPGGKALLIYGSVNAIVNLKRIAAELNLKVKTLDDRDVMTLPEEFLPGMMLEVSP